MNDFLAKAPPEVIQRERDKLIELEARRKSIQTDIERLKKAKDEKDASTD